LERQGLTQTVARVAQADRASPMNAAAIDNHHSAELKAHSSQSHKPKKVSYLR
jgi:hypothetical protein